MRAEPSLSVGRATGRAAVWWWGAVDLQSGGLRPSCRGEFRGVKRVGEGRHPKVGSPHFVRAEYRPDLHGLEQLQAVQIGHSSRVTDRAFESFRKMKNLRFLTIYDGVSDQAAQQFHKDRPEVIMHVRGVNYGDHSQLYMNRKRNASGS